MLADPHFRAREAIISVADETYPELQMQNVVPKLSDTPGSIRWSGPALGEHNREIYQGLLELGDEDFAQLQARKII
jgi:crotonobetainyl-CoA:carnitine CoA-transferase CaiB-like acyl-CoA transferase